MKRLDWISALLILWALALHGAFYLSAGALWRDEANSAAQAALPSWTALWRSLDHDSFPAAHAALVRMWCAHGGETDSGLRVLGAATGLALLGSVAGAALWLGLAPALALAVAAVNPLVVSEGDSIRPYGLALIALVWAFAAYGRLASGGRTGVVAAAAVASIAAVQCAYTNALYVGLFALAAMASAKSRRWVLLIPAGAAALSLAPYAGVLARTRGWTGIVRYRVEWSPFVTQMAREHGVTLIVFAGAWSAAAWTFLRLIRQGRAAQSLPLYVSGAAALALPLQALFLVAAGAPPFPRYFLPCLVVAALAASMVGRQYRFGAAAALAVALAGASPAWSWVRLRRTDMDQVAAVLNRRAQPRDLVILSPWFLHPSFQRYYRGAAPWITIPELPPDPMTRYALVKEAMRAPDSAGRLQRELDGVLARGGVLWYVSQRLPEPQPASLPPERPPGQDYARFRRYWEADIERRLLVCCRSDVEIAEGAVPTWREENLMLTRFTRSGK